jgi:hypothetical protein
VGPALRLSCRSELHVLPQFPVAQTIRSPDYDELRGPHRVFAVRAGVLWLRLPSRDLTPESLRGFELLRILPSVLPVTSLHETSCGFHRFEPVKWNGVATAPGNVTYPTRNFAEVCYFACAKGEPVPFRTHPACRHAARTISSPTIASSSSVFGV